MPMNLINIFRTICPNAKEYTFFPSTCGTFSTTDHILDYKSSRSKFKKIEIISSIFFDQNAMSRYQLQRKTCNKNSNIWSLNNMSLSKNKLLKK